MIQRKDYLDKKATHREYYGQFVTAATKRLVLRVFSVDQLKASRDPHMDDLPLSKWDCVFPRPISFELGKMFKEAGDYATQTGLICIAKEAAKQIVEN